MELKPKKLFNPTGNDERANVRIFGGNPTNIINLSNKRYGWTKQLIDNMIDNTWFPHIISLVADASEYANLSEEEIFAFDRTLSFLTFLDSIQTHNIPRISDYVTASDVVVAMTIQANQEAIHNISYSHIIDSVIPANKRDTVYGYWKEDEVLFNRNKTIADIYQNFSDRQTDENFVKAILANYVLESVYFYNGFMFFYTMGAKGKLLGVQEEIQLINRDERTHVTLYANIINEIMQENPGLITEEIVHEVFTSGVESEIEWAIHSYGDRILGITPQSSEWYTKHLATRAMAKIGFSTIFQSDDFDVTVNPYAHLEKSADDEETRVNFFESNAQYQQSSAVEDWDLD